jgi:hypothetical protein
MQASNTCMPIATWYLRLLQLIRRRPDHNVAILFTLNVVDPRILATMEANNLWPEGVARRDLITAAATRTAKFVTSEAIPS